MTQTMAWLSASEWLERFKKNDVPAQLVLTPYQATTSDYARARDLVRESDGQRLLTFPAVVDGKPAGHLERTAPALGEDSRQILQELGFDGAQAGELIRCGAVHAASNPAA
jgi:crotonobetainyl-CoA:carnitine CoA-transferase CaiB-like acyl-CoA transferase